MTRKKTPEMRQKMADDVRSSQARLRLSNAELADKAQVSSTIIDHLRNAKGNPGINNIHKVYEALGLEKIELLNIYETATAQ